MSKMRLRFSKKGRSSYISHLDLMSVFKRAFLRAGMSVKHTEGFNPHAYVSAALPLPVGHESDCELLDFGLEEPFEDLAEKLSEALPEGIEVQKAYLPQRAVKEIAYTENLIIFEYDAGVPEDAEKLISELLCRDEILVTKKTKKGLKESNIAGCIKEVRVRAAENLEIRAVLTVKEQYLNPVYLTEAVMKYFPQLAPDGVNYIRTEIFDDKMNPFE